MKSRKVPAAKTVAAWHEAIATSGAKRIKLRALLGRFGAKRRGSAVQQAITPAELSAFGAAGSLLGKVAAFIARATEHAARLEPRASWPSGEAAVG